MDEVDSRISPSLHPETVRQIDGYSDSEVAPFLAPVESAFSEAYQALGSIHDAKQAGLRNLTLTPSAQLLQIDDYAGKKLSKITKGFDSVAASLDKSIASIESDLSKPVESKAAHTVATEIRGYVRGLDTGERMKLVQRAIDEGDHTTAQSVLGAPAFLSGLDPKMQAVLTRMYHERHNPVQAKRLKAMQAAKGLLDRNAPLAIVEVDKAVGYLTDPKTSRKIYPAEIRAQVAASTKPFAA